MALQTLTQKRGGNRGVVTKRLAKLQDIVDDTTLDRDLKIYELDKKLQDLHAKLKLIETSWNRTSEVWMLLAKRLTRFVI